MHNLREGKTPQRQATLVQKKPSRPRTIKSIQKSLSIFICSLRLRSRQLSGFSLPPWSLPRWGWRRHHYTETASHTGGPGPLPTAAAGTPAAGPGTHQAPPALRPTRLCTSDPRGRDERSPGPSMRHRSHGGILQPPLGHVSLGCGLEHRTQPWHEPPPSRASKGKEKGQISALPLF